MCVTSTVIDGWSHPTWPQPILPHNPFTPGAPTPNGEELDRLTDLVVFYDKALPSQEPQ